VSDLKLDDFELYDNGKKQNLKFMEWVSVETGEEDPRELRRLCRKTWNRLATRVSR